MTNQSVASSMADITYYHDAPPCWSITLRLNLETKHIHAKMAHVHATD